ncbi:MAG TPA: PorV/PorQ family protein [Bacteroidota bacterium]|nr:PorV/PorQ family protein [Bacteroidota bacterium]
MKNVMLSLLATFCVALIVIDVAQAQNRRVGTAAATELLIPVGARDLALGGASIANTVGVDAIYWNPAGLGRMTHDAEGMFSTMNYIADIGVSYGAVAGKFGEFGVVGLSIKSLDFGDIPLTTTEDSEGEGGRFFSPTYFTLGFSYGRQLTDRIAAGGTAKIISETIDRVSATGIAFDFGVQYHGLVGITGLQLGVTVKNIGSQMKFDGPGLLRPAVASGGRRPEQPFKSEAASFELPSIVEIGVGYKALAAENFTYGLSGSFTNNNLYFDEYRIGGEVSFDLPSITLFGRAGTSLVPDAGDRENENIFGMTFGGGITYAAGDVNLTLDFAYRQVELFDANTVVSLKLGF